jgi:hypothetical protein
MLSLHYLAHHRAILAGSEIAHQDDATFLADDGEPLTIWSVSMLFKRLVKVIGMSSDVWGLASSPEYDTLYIRQ